MDGSGVPGRYVFGYEAVWSFGGRASLSCTCFMENSAVMRAAVGLLLLTLMGGVLLYSMFGVVFPEARTACVWAWTGTGLIALLAFWLRKKLSGMAVALAPTAVRLFLLPLWLGGVAWIFSPPLLPFAFVSIGAVLVFLVAEVALTLRNLRR
ncbi:MAG: hypothetical protein N2170_02690 [Bacteroidia bacterium]|nr:hypothetical protein [Bacteroidia bacterium]